MTAATAPRGADIHRIGTVRIRFADFRAELVITVPPHTAMNITAAEQYLAAQIKPHVLMYLPLHIGPQDYTVTVDLRHLFTATDDQHQADDTTPRPTATATLTEVLRGAARVRRKPAVFGTATLTPEDDPAPAPAPPPRRRR